MKTNHKFVLATFFMVCISSVHAFDVRIGQIWNVEQGKHAQVGVFLESNELPLPELGGFDLLIRYDASFLSLTAVLPGSLVTDCGWEYFTYRYGPNGGCGSNPCPSGVVRIISIAEYNTGDQHPSCFSDLSGHMFTLDFLVTNDHTAECGEVPIRFVWYDCGDNGLATTSGDSLLISDRVFESFTGEDITNPAASFPTYFGTPYACDVPPVRTVNFHNGGLVIACLPNIDVAPLQVIIQEKFDVQQGNHEYVSVLLEDNDRPLTDIGGFDFLMTYSKAALSFTGAIPGDLYDNCGWEYFTYRYGGSDGCFADSLTRGVVQVVSIAETNNGAVHPTCFSNASSRLFTLDFLVTNDRTWDCSKLPIEFLWCDCGDNMISSKTGDTLLISNSVFSSFRHTNIADSSATYPTTHGAQADCAPPIYKDLVRYVDFYNGGMHIDCADSIDYLICDINLNGIAYEIADYSLFRNSLVYGDTVFSIDRSHQINNTDINRNGTALEISDLVYLAGVIRGDFLPYPVDIQQWPNDVYLMHNVNTSELSVSTDVPLGALWMEFVGQASGLSTPTNCDIISHYNGVTTRVLLSSLDGATINLGVVLKYNPNDSPILLSAETATAEADFVNLVIDSQTSALTDSENMPDRFALRQNYPNPFNPLTTISFELAKSTNYDLIIYNALGQVIEQFTGHGSPGAHTIEWDGSDHSSGIYFYQLTAEEFSDSRKMLLLK